MNEFNNRMNAQREVLGIINQSSIYTEKLCGLSTKAIERWAEDNFINKNSDIFNVLKDISGKLFFLANKSQEQVSEDYMIASREVSFLAKKLIALLAERPKVPSH